MLLLLVAFPVQHCYTHNNANAANSLLKTKHQPTVIAVQKGTDYNVYIAHYTDGRTNKTIYYKIIKNNATNAKTYYFRYSNTQRWTLLPPGCPAPIIQEDTPTNGCVMGWKIGKRIAKDVVYLSIKRGRMVATKGLPDGTA